MDSGSSRGSETGAPKPTKAELRDTYAAVFRAQYLAFQYHFVEFMTAHLVRCSHRFGGDLEEMLVLAVIGQMHLRSELHVTADGHAGRRMERTDISISASRIADVTGIPRPTVRRKLAKLGKRGWIEQNADKSWKLVITDGKSPAGRDLADLDAFGIEGAAGLMAALRPLTG
jgi:DNA-binding MarR family transcriptional regulator